MRHKVRFHYRRVCQRVSGEADDERRQQRSQKKGYLQTFVNLIPAVATDFEEGCTYQPRYQCAADTRTRAMTTETGAQLTLSTNPVKIRVLNDPAIIASIYRGSSRACAWISRWKGHTSLNSHDGRSDVSPRKRPSQSAYLLVRTQRHARPGAAEPYAWQTLDRPPKPLAGLLQDRRRSRRLMSRPPRRRTPTRTAAPLRLLPPRSMSLLASAPSPQLAQEPPRARPTTPGRFRLLGVSEGEMEGRGCRRPLEIKKLILKIPPFLSAKLELGGKALTAA